MEKSLEIRVVELEIKLATTEKLLAELGSAFEWFLDDHRREHCELSPMIYRSYCKTHPEYCNTMDHYHDIVAGRIKPDGDDKAT